jgi:hypothetical protein
MVEIMPYPDITWAGENPFVRGYCLGNESGEILLTGMDGRTTLKNRVSRSGEAINGLAYSKHCLAVTTRRDITFIHDFLPGKQSEASVMDFGGHEVLAAPISGHFVIPLGPDGLMFVKPAAGADIPVSISKSDSHGLNFCRVLPLPGSAGSDLVVAAGRRGGLAFADYRDGIDGQLLHIIKFPELDIVDLCSLSTTEKPRAILVAAKDGTLVYFDDVAADKSPQIVKFRGIAGTVDRVLTIKGDVYLFTSLGLFSLFGLGHQLSSRKTVQPLISRTDLDTADANTVYDRWLLVVGGDCVYCIDTEGIPRTSNGDMNSTNGDRWETPDQLTIQPNWEESTVHMAAACV